MIVFPNAKINLGLNIIDKRPDGYHNLETVFYPVPWRDVLEVIPAKTTTLTLSGIPVNGDPENNLVMKALRLLQRDFKLGDFSIFLQKNIPFGAGLGGGSADGAQMLVLLNKLCGLSLTDQELAQYAVKLGADCPFFINNKPVFATGIGDVMTPMEVSLSSFKIVIVKPGIDVSTSDAYAMIVPRHPERSVRSIVELPIPEWRSVLINDFELSVFDKYPEIGHIKELLYDEGAIYASMSGSGSAVFGIFPAHVHPQLAISGCKIWIGQ